MPQIKELLDEVKADLEQESRDEAKAQLKDRLREVEEVERMLKKLKTKFEELLEREY